MFAKIVFTSLTIFLMSATCLAQRITSSSASVHMVARVRPMVNVRAASSFVRSGNSSLTVATVGEGRIEIFGSVEQIDSSDPEISIPLQLTTNVKSVLYRLEQADASGAGEISIEHGGNSGRYLPISAGRVVGMGTSLAPGTEQTPIVHIKVAKDGLAATKQIRIVLEVVANDGRSFAVTSRT